MKTVMASIRRLLSFVGLLPAMLVGVWPGTSAVMAEEPLLQLATFRADVTPPIGDGPCVGFMPKIESIDHPLELRGIVLRANGQTFVIAALDYQGLCNSSDDEFRRRMAEAAGTTVGRVALQSLHQHSAPVLDADAMRLLHGDDSEPLRQHLAFTKQMAERAAAAIREALPKLKPVTHIVGSRAKAERFASNRRVPQPDGSLLVRGSATRDPLLQEAPEGLIDPWLRTVTFFEAERPSAQLHYYATHPMSFYGDARISWDVPGLARQRLEQETGVFQIYFNGCGGNIGMGKYNNATRAAREQLTDRLFDAMRRSARVAAGSAVSETETLDATIDLRSLKPAEIAWDQADLRFTVRDADVAAGVQAPALFLDFRDRRPLAQAGDVGVGRLGKMGLEQLGRVVMVLRLLAPIQPDDVGQELDLRRRELAMGAVDLREDVPRVDEQDMVAVAMVATVARRWVR